MAKASAYYEAGKWPDAEKLLRKILRQHPMHLDANFLLGNLLAMQGRPAQALVQLKRAAEIRPNSVQIQNNLGNVFRNLKRYDEALACYEQALKVAPNFLSTLQNLGFTYQALGLNEQAAVYFHKALAISPEDDDIRFALALLDEAPLPERFPIRSTLSAYEKKAEHWDDDDSYKGPELLEQALHTYWPDARNLHVMDLGCGTGACGVYLRSVASCLVGVDLSPDMLAVARQKKVYDELAEGEIVDVLAKDTRQFDLITAAGVFILFGALSHPFKAVSDRLQSGGLFMLTLYKGEQGQGEDGVSLRHNMHFAHDQGHIQQAAAFSGCEIVALEEVVHEFYDGQPQAGYLVVMKKH